MNLSKEQKNLVNGIYSLFVDNVTCIDTWGFYLFNQEFDKEPELRNKIGVIWLGSLLDSLAAEVKIIEKYKLESERLNMPHMQYYCELALNFFGSVKDILRLYNRDEQIFLVYLRNQWVHSFLSGRHNENIGIKYFDGDNFIQKSIPTEEFHKVVYPFFKGKSIDETVEPMVRRFMDKNLRYWEIITDLQKNHAAMQQCMLNGENIRISTLCV